MSEQPDLRTPKIAIADGFCSAGWCGGDTSSAPCGHAQDLADIAIEALNAAEYEIVRKPLASLIKAGVA